MVWLGVVAAEGLVVCGLWALGDHLRTRILREHSDPARRYAARGMRLRRWLFAVIVGAGVASVGVAVLLVVIELRG